MFDIKQGATPVLNEYYDQIVFIPTELPIIQTLKKRDDIDLLVIDHRDYDELVERYANSYTFEDKGDEPSCAVFVTRYNATNGYGSNHITKEGWGVIFNYFRENQVTLTDMLSGFPKYANAFQENTAADVLDHLDIEHDDVADEDKVVMAINAIHDNDNMSFVESHKTHEGVEWIIYSES